VLEEVVVLAGDEGEDHVLGDVLEADEPAPLLVELADRVPVLVEDGRREGRPVVLEPVEVGQVGDDRQIERDDGPGHAADHQHDEAHEREQDPRRPGPHRLLRGDRGKLAHGRGPGALLRKPCRAPEPSCPNPSPCSS
jgi:hypothetical protein